MFMPEMPENYKGGIKTKMNETADQPKVVAVPRAVSSIEMLNIINDKIDYLIMKLEEKK